jgi:hypothetical protein
VVVAESVAERERLADAAALLHQQQVPAQRRRPEDEHERLPGRECAAALRVGRRGDELERPPAELRRVRAELLERDRGRVPAERGAAVHGAVGADHQVVRVDAEVAAGEGAGHLDLAESGAAHAEAGGKGGEAEPGRRRAVAERVGHDLRAAQLDDALGRPAVGRGDDEAARVGVDGGDAELLAEGRGEVEARVAVGAEFQRHGVRRRAAGAGGVAVVVEREVVAFQGEGGAVEVEHDPGDAVGGLPLGQLDGVGEVVRGDDPGRRLGAAAGEGGEEEQERGCGAAHGVPPGVSTPTSGVA